MEDRQVGGSGFPGQHWDKEMEIVKSWRGTGLGEFTINFISLYTVKHFFFAMNSCYNSMDNNLSGGHN